MLRVGVVGVGDHADAVTDALRGHGVDVRPAATGPVALTVGVVRVGGPEVPADAVLVAPDPAGAAAAATELYRTRLAPWAQSLVSTSPDVPTPPRLLPHDPGWVAVADRRGGALCAALAAADPADRLGLRRVDHVGSTAVPGLAAKPFLDLQLTVDRLPDVAWLAAALAPLGWVPASGARPDSPGVHRDLPAGHDTASAEVFAKRLLVAPDPVRPAILHVRLTGSPFGRRVVRFRDRLRADPQLRRDYEQVKRRAAAAHADARDYDDYTRDKGAWLAGVHPHTDTWAGGADDPWPLDRGAGQPTSRTASP
ncbi:GrpB family protein [Geodermatophilus sp. DSM 44513]|uniref:GrpB family protein n=1 Tax=Geodermatophilus sp. DSM 44513 TaxID=1528104 RepID=UPI00127BFD58|nr:GrpB family protein [Geodermatophilus sp. DSM 44513]WNV73944.1 GrpB family protein [Geodermatophilus sp. DSM 44513]